MPEAGAQAGQTPSTSLASLSEQVTTHTILYSYRFILAIALVIARPLTAWAQGTSADSQAIRHLIQAHATAWNHRDAKAAAAVMTPDAVWITSSGTTLHGRAEIERAHREWLAEDSAAGGSTHAHPVASISIRFLRSGVAVGLPNSLTTMTELLAALRSLVYMAGFLFLWGWLALQVRSIGAGWTLPQDSRAVGTVLMIVGGLVVLSCVSWFVVIGRGTQALRPTPVIRSRRPLPMGPQPDVPRRPARPGWLWVVARLVVDGSPGPTGPSFGSPFCGAL
jgi:uncharacterized protein (TIGR02246 family)